MATAISLDMYDHAGFELMQAITGLGDAKRFAERVHRSMTFTAQDGSLLDDHTVHMELERLAKVVSMLDDLKDFFSDRQRSLMLQYDALGR